MIALRFNEVVSALHTLATQIAATKRPGYTQGNSDVLHNFKTTADMLNITPMQAWCVYFLKHVNAIVSYTGNPTLPQAEGIAGRIADAMNYLDLLAGLIVDAQDEAEDAQRANNETLAATAPLAQPVQERAAASAAKVIPFPPTHNL